MQQLNIAVLLSGHGFGHVTRTATILTALARIRPISLRVMTSAPSRLWPAALQAHTTEWIAEPCDAGVVQRDELVVDLGATRRAVEMWETGRAAQIDRTVSWLRRGADSLHLILGDAPPLAFEVAETLGIPSVAIANFSWDWIYREMGLTAAADAASRAYYNAELLLELTPSAPMTAFRERVRVGTVGRDSRASRERTRAVLGLDAAERLVLLSFRRAFLSRITLPPLRDGWHFIANGVVASRRSDAGLIPDGIEFADALAASDVVVAKTGYGILADCTATGRPLLWVPREGFPEDRVLEAWLGGQGWARRIDRSSLAAGDWGADLAAAVAAPSPAPQGHRAVHSACAAINRWVS